MNLAIEVASVIALTLGAIYLLIRYMDPICAFMDCWIMSPEALIRFCQKGRK